MGLSSDLGRPRYSGGICRTRTPSATGLVQDAQPLSAVQSIATPTNGAPKQVTPRERGLVGKGSLLCISGFRVLCGPGRGEAPPGQKAFAPGAAPRRQARPLVSRG